MPFFRVTRSFQNNPGFQNAFTNRLFARRPIGLVRGLGTKRQRAVTLVEVMVSVMIFAIICLGLMGSITFLIRQARANRAHYYAVQFANNYVGLLSAATYRDLGSPDLEGDEFETLFISSKANPLIEYSNNEDDDGQIEYRIWLEFTGWGKVSAADEKHLTIDLPDNQNPWDTNEWAGSYVTITKTPSGRGGQGQVARIVSNGGNSMTVCRDLTGNDTSEGFVVVPEVGSDVVINNGKTVRLYVQWGDGKAYRTIVREIVIARPL